MVAVSETVTCRLDRWSICKYLKTDHKAETDPLPKSVFAALPRMPIINYLRFK